MGCGGRQKHLEVRPEQKWDYISLKDFKSNSCLTVFAYSYVFFSLGLSIAVYAVDTFTAVNLLVYNKWSSQIEPTTIIPFDVSKWIFSGCIIASVVNLVFEHIRARRVMVRGSVAECYLDNLAVRLESAKLGRGQGWRRFLVFAELTKSKKGAEYIALFTYFSFQSWVRVIFCSGPRQVINALTLYAVYNSQLIPTEFGSVDRTLMNFFGKIETLASQDYQQAIILSGMLFTLVVWVFSFISLLIAVVFFVFFLWHYIPRQDGGLSGYCSRKINKRLMKVVSVKVNKAIAKEEEDRLKAERKAAKKAGEKTPLGMQASMPSLPTFMDGSKADSLSEMPTLSHSDTMSTLPPYVSRPGTPGSIEMSALDQKKPIPSRQATQNSTFSSRAPLLGGASPMGMERSASPAPSLNMNYPAARPGTAQSNRSFDGPGQMQRTQTGNSSGFGAPYTASPSLSNQNMPAMPAPIRSPVPMDNYGRPMPRPVNQLAGRPMPDNASIRDGRASPAPSMYSNRGPPPNGPVYNGPAYQQPMRSATNPMPRYQQPQYQQPQRNMTAPMPPRQQQDYFNPRPGTSASQRGRAGPGYGYNNDVEAQRGPGPRY